MRDRIKCLKCEKFFYRNNKSVVCPTCIQKDSKEYYTKKIADLEAKLAELREQITILDEENSKTFMKSVNAWRENAELKQQLAESEDKIKKAYQEGLLQKQFDKDMEIEQLKQQLAKIKEDYEQLDLSTGYYISDLKEELTEKDKEIEKLKTLVDVIDKYRQYDKDAKNLLLFNPENCCFNGHKLIIKTDKIDYGVELLERARELVKNIHIDNSGFDAFGFQESTRDSCVEKIDQLITEIKEGK